MNYFKVNGLLVVLLIFALIIGCSKDKSTEPNDEGPTFVAKTISVPQNMQQSSDPMAQMAMNHIISTNAMSSFASFFSPKGLLKSNAELGATEWEKKWQQDGMTVTLTSTENDTGYKWVVRLDGTSQTEGITYNNFVFLTIEQNKAATAGKFTLFDYEKQTSDPFIIWSWNTLPGDILHFVRTFYADGIPEVRSVIFSNPDKSGELYFYEYVNGTFVLEFQAAWAATGSGQWWSYDEFANITDSGNW